MDLSLKSVEATHVDLSVKGKICIEQWSHEFGKHVCVYLSPEQFDQIRRWYEHNYLEILHVWNSGVSDGEG